MSASLIGGLGSSAFRLAALRHRDIDGSDLALGVDLHGLLAAGGSQRRKSRSLDEHLDLATARRALQIAEKIPARFAPVAVNAVTLARNVGTQVEFVAVAGAVESLLQTQSGAVDIVAGLASDALGCSVGKRDCAVAGPRSVKTGKWPRLGMAYRHRQHERSADPSSRDSLSQQAGAEQFHIEFSHSNDVTPFRIYEYTPLRVCAHKTPNVSSGGPADLKISHSITADP